MLPDCIWVCLRTPVSNDLALSVHKELCEVPWNLTGNFILCVVKLAVDSEELVNGISIFSVDVAFLEHLPFCAESLRECFDLCVGPGLLLAELVARKSKNFETLVSILRVDGGHLLVVFSGESSLGGYIDDKRTSCSCY